MEKPGVLVPSHFVALVVCSVSSFSHSLEVHMKAHSTELGVGAGEGGCIQN